MRVKYQYYRGYIILFRDLLKQWKRWIVICNQTNENQSDMISSKILLGIFVAQTLASVVLKSTDRLWWIIGLCDQFFEFLLKINTDGLISILTDVLSETKPIPHPDDSQFSNRP